MNLATIEINRLRITARHGVFTQEHDVGNDYEVDIHLRYPIDSAVLRDNVNAAINYATVVDLVKREMAHTCQLLETVADNIRGSLTHSFPEVIGGKVRVAKLTPPIPNTQVASIAVTVEW